MPFIYPPRGTTSLESLQADLALIFPVSPGINGDFEYVPEKDPLTMLPTFGIMTQGAVREFQRRQMLPETGAVDWITGNFLIWAAKRAIHRDLLPQPHLFEHFGPDVTRLRDELIKWRKANAINPPDGVIQADRQQNGHDTYGGNSIDAVRQFKGRRDLSYNGQANRMMANLLARINHPLVEGDAYIISGQISSGAGITMQLYARSPQDQFLLGEVQTSAGGNFSIHFQIVGSGPGRLELYVQARVADRQVPNTDFAFALEFDALTGNPIPFPAANIGVALHIICGLVVRPVGREELPEQGIQVRAVGISLDTSGGAVSYDPRVYLDTDVSDATGFYVLAFAFTGGDVRVEAFDPLLTDRPVLATTPTFFNLAPIEYIARLVLPPAGIKPPANIQPPHWKSEFELLVEELRAAGHPPEGLGEKLALKGPAERNLVLRHMAGDLVVAHDTILRPKPDSDDIRSDAVRYEQEVERFIRDKIVPVAKVILAFQLAKAAADQLGPAGLAYQVRIPRPDGQFLTLQLRKNGPATPLLLENAFYALLPDAKTEIAADQALQFVTRMPAAEIRLQLETAVGDNLIKLSPAEIEQVIVWLAAYRLAIPNSAQWGADVDHLDNTGAARTALSAWLAAENDTLDTFRKITPTAGIKTLQWKALTLDLEVLETALRNNLPGNADPAIDDLAKFDVVELRQILDLYANVTSGDVQGWPAPLTQLDGNVGAALDVFLKFVRSYVPYRPRGATLLEDACFELCFYLVEVARAILRLPKTGGGPIVVIEDLRHVADVGADGLFDSILASAQVLRGGVEAWQNWPLEIRGDSSTASARLLFDHIRRVHPSAATGLVAFFAQNPGVSLESIQSTDWTAINQQVTVAVQGDAAHRATVFSELRILKVLWDATIPDEDRPALRSDAIVWLRDHGKTTVALVASISDPELLAIAPADLQAAVQRARAFARGDTLPNSLPPGLTAINQRENLYDCEAPPHRSLLGPAKYLVYLHKLAIPNPPAVPVTPLYTLARPDIPSLVLDQPNTESLLPEIDIVNELLESLCAGTAITAHQSTRTSDELAILPEYAAPASAFACWSQLRTSYSPAPLPYDQRLDATRTYLDALETSRAAVMRLFRREIAWHHRNHMVRFPVDEEVAWEVLQFSLEEVNLLESPLSGQLYQYFAFPISGAVPSDSDVITELTKLRVFLRHCSLELEEFQELLQQQPAWLQLTTDPTPIGCNVPGALVRERGAGGLPVPLTRETLSRLYQHLLLWRHFRGKFGPCESPRDEFWIIRRIVESLDYYRDNSGAWRLNPDFLWELASLQMLWHEVSLNPCWCWHDEDPVTGGLSFARDLIDDQRGRLAQAVHLLATTQEGTSPAWLEHWQILELLSGVQLADHTTADWNLRIRRALRLVELAKKIARGKFPTRQLHLQFWGLYDATANPDGAQPTLVAYPDPAAGFGELNDDFRRSHLVPITRTAASTNDVIVLKGLVKDLLESLGFRPATAVPPGDHSSDGICNRLARILARLVPAHQQYSVDYPAGIPKPPTPDCWRLPDPFVIEGEKKIKITRSPTEKEIVAALQCVSRISHVAPGWTPAHKLALRKKVAELSQLPRNDLRFLLPLLPNQREALQRLIDPESETAPPPTEPQKWRYVYHQLDTLRRTLVEHFVEHCNVPGSVLSPDEVCNLVHLLLFGTARGARQWENRGGGLTPFSSILESPYESTGQSLLNLPNVIWRDLVLPRGTGLWARYFEGRAAGPAFERRDGDLQFISPGKGLDLDHCQPWPFGWSVDTPDPTRLPASLEFCDEPTPAWRAEWTGELRLPLEQRSKDIFIAINLGCCHPNDNYAELKVGGQVTTKWVPCECDHTGDVITWQQESGPRVSQFAVFGPFRQLDEFSDLSVTFADPHECRESAQIALSYVAIPKQSPGCPPRLSGFRPVPAEWHFKHDSKYASYFRDAYRRTWLACYYALHLELIQPEVSHFASNRWDFAGYDPTFGNVTSTTTMPFNLDVFHPHMTNPATPAGDRRALFDLWERLRAYVCLREWAKLNGGLSTGDAAERLIRVFDQALLGGSGDVTAATFVPLLQSAFGWDNSVTTVKALEQSLDYVPKGTITAVRLKCSEMVNQEWLHRIYLAADFLRSGHPWMKSADRMSGNLAREIVYHPLNSTVSAGLRALFTATHDTGAPATSGILTKLHDGLRERARAAMLAYLAVKRSGGGHDGKSVSDLSNELLIDVDCDLDRRLTRVESAIASLQRFLSRHNFQPGPNVEYLRFEAWQTQELPQLFPENYVAERTLSQKSLAFREFERRLQFNQLSLHQAGANSVPNTNGYVTLEFVEDLQRQIETSLAGGISGLEPHRGWLAPLGSTFPDGWQPGPNGLRATVLHTENNSEDFLFWPVPSAEHVDNVQEKDYSAPDATGAPTAAVAPVGAIRLGWSRKKRTASQWEESQLSNLVVRVVDPYAVTLVVQKQGSQLLVSCGSGEGFVVELAAPAAVPLLPPPVITPRFLPAASYGGLTTLPSQIIPDADLLAPPLPLVQPPSAVAPGSLPPFGLTADEKDFFVAFEIARRLLRQGQFEYAKHWLEQIFDVSQQDLSTLFSASGRATDRAVTLQLLEVLQKWSLTLLRENTEESCRLAAVLARKLAELLGPAPRYLNDIHPGGLTLAGATATPGGHFEPASHLLNPRLRASWSFLARLNETVRRRLNAAGQKRPQARNNEHQFFQRSEFVDRDLAARSAYRFTYLLQKAVEAANEVKVLGQALQTAYEKGDTEHLAMLRANSELQIAELNRDQRTAQWKEAEAQWRILRQNRFNTEFRKLYYEELIGGGLIGGERSHLDLLQTSADLTIAAQAVELVAQAITLIPDLTVGSAGISSPVILNKLTGGEKISRMLEFVARGIHTVAGKIQVDANRALTTAGYDRRRREWEFQRESARLEIIWLERQIDAARQRIGIARNELNIMQQQAEFARRNFDFLRTKFSNTELNDWLRDELTSLYELAFQQAVELAQQCELAFNTEKHFNSSSFIDPAKLNFTRTPLLADAPLLAGDALLLALRRMEKQYHDDNIRENELLLHFSLRLHRPSALIALRTTGVCEVEIPEWLFDMNYPGHYLRRLKSVTLSLPCVLAPYQSVNCTLTQLASTIRHAPGLAKGYPEVLSSSGDPRFVRTFAAGQSIATSSGQNDSGLFELNFRDDRLLPFEGTGAVSRWRIELPLENNWFDLNSLTDAVIHLRYTSLDGGEPLRTAARQFAYTQIPSLDYPAERLIDLRHDLPAEWEKLQENVASGFCFDTRYERFFPWQSDRVHVHIGEVEILAVCSSCTCAQTAKMRVTFPDNTSRDITLFNNPTFPDTLSAVIDGKGISPGKWSFSQLELHLPPKELFVKISVYYTC